MCQVWSMSSAQCLKALLPCGHPARGQRLGDRGFLVMEVCEQRSRAPGRGRMEGFLLGEGYRPRKPRPPRIGGVRVQSLNDWA